MHYKKRSVVIFCNDALLIDICCFFYSAKYSEL